MNRQLSSSRPLWGFLCVFILFVALAAADRKYKDGDQIPFLVNTIGPYANPSEIYSYYSLPVCAPPKGQRSADRSFNLGEQLEGDEFKKSLYVLNFKSKALIIFPHPFASASPMGTIVNLKLFFF